MTEAQLRDLPVFRTSSAFAPFERVVLEYAVAMTKTPVDVPDPLFAALRTRLNDAQLVELTAAIAWQNYRSRFDHAFGTEAQGFSDGAYCPLPEREATG